MKKFLVAVLFILLSQGAHANNKVVLKTVGQVDKEIVTSRTVQIYSGIEQALYQSKKKIQIPDIETVSFRFRTNLQKKNSCNSHHSRQFALNPF